MENHLNFRHHLSLLWKEAWHPSLHLMENNLNFQHDIWIERGYGLTSEGNSVLSMICCCSSSQSC